MKGADQCPKCASRRWGDTEQGVTGFYAATLRVCANCGTAWEPFDPAQLLDVDLPKTSSFIDPCDNCAFRPGSPEQQDRARWKGLMRDIALGARFYCHKGVPVTPGSDHGFDYPGGGTDPTKLRHCRGYLKVWGARTTREWERLRTELQEGDAPGFACLIDDAEPFTD